MDIHTLLNILSQTRFVFENHFVVRLVFQNLVREKECLLHFTFGNHRQKLICNHITLFVTNQIRISMNLPETSIQWDRISAQMVF